MSREELVAALDHLDPGASLAVDAVVIEELFGGEGRDVEAFAEEHRCTFAPAKAESPSPQFTKTDIY